MRLFSLCCVVVIASAFPEKDLSTGRSYETEKVDARISGGERAKTGFFYQAQIIRQGHSFCSGAVINPLHVLTAAHCVDNANPRDITLYYASRDRGVGSSVLIEEIVRHPNYDYPQNNFDIAYLRTMLPMYISPEYEAVAIPDVNTPPPREVTVSGFGVDEKDGNKLSDQLKFVKLPIISQLECQAFYPEKSITKNMICAHSNRDMGKGTCPGDGGDPAVDKASNSSLLIGISSFSRGCGPGQGPSVFTYIAAKEIHDFIVNGTNIHHKKKKTKPEKPSEEEAETPCTEQTERAPKEECQRPSEKPNTPSKEECQMPSKEKPSKMPHRPTRRPHRPTRRPHRPTRRPHRPFKEMSEEDEGFLPGRPKEENEGTCNEISEQDAGFLPPERPSDELPERPLEDVPEPPSHEKPERLSKEKPERPSENISERPFEEEPERPSEKNPERPSEKNPERPSDDMPERPLEEEEEPERSSEKNPERPLDDMAERPLEEEPERPSDEMPESSVEKLPEGLSDEIHEIPSEEIPESSFKEKSEKSSREKPERPSEEYSEKTSTH